MKSATKVWKQRQVKKSKTETIKSTTNRPKVRSASSGTKTNTLASSNKKRPIPWKYLTAMVIVFTVLTLGAIGSYMWIFKDLPSPTNLTKDAYPVSTEIYDRNGTLLYQIYANQNRKPVPLSQIPIHLKQATIAIEDKDFYKHSGFALRGIARAIYKNVAQHEVQGGSTITQQLIKTALLTPEQTIQRKVRELILSGITELLYSKDQILELYLNHIPYGGTAYGIEQAAQTYFGKSARDLNLAESALLAGLPQAPSRYSPFGASPELAKQRQVQVLQRMVEDGYITAEQKKEVENTELHYARQATDIKAPHFVLYVKDLLETKYGQQRVEQGGLRVTTSLDLALQEHIEATVAAEIATLEQYHVTNGAALVTTPATGEILAMVGSRGYFDETIDGNVNLTTSLRQPGSSIKPINYALGLLKGYPASTLLLDIPTCFSAAGQPNTYCPKNYDGKFHGPQQMRQSLANSYNIPAVKMLALNGIEDFIATASAMGISTWKDPSNYGLSLTLGGGEVKMTDMAVAFGVFANSGIRIDLNPILKVETYRGEVLEHHNHQFNPPTGKRILPPEVTYIISNILADNSARMAAFGANSKLVIPGKTVSVKTGTTDDLRDNWTIGYTPEFLTAVWVGNNDNTKMTPGLVSGVTGAAPIWHDIMTHILSNREDAIPPKPENVVNGRVCTTYGEGEQKMDSCEGRFEYYINSMTSNKWHGSIAKKNTWIDKETGRPPVPDKTDNLELQEKTMASDAFTSDYCLDYNHDNEPPFIISMEKFTEKLHEQAEKQSTAN